MESISSVTSLTSAPPRPPLLLILVKTLFIILYVESPMILERICNAGLGAILNLPDPATA